MKKIICVMIVMMIGITACGKEQNTSVVTNQIREKEEDKKVFTAHQLEIPFDRNTTQLDYIAEECIGVLVNSKGEIEMLTLTRSVKEEYRQKAEKMIKEKKQLTADMLECRVWKFMLDEDDKWKREAVSEKALFDEKDIVDENADFVKYAPIYNSEGNLVIIVCFNKKLGEGQEKYVQRVYCLSDKKWGYMGEYSYVEKDNTVQEPIKYAMDTNNHLLVAKMDGTVTKYDFGLKQEIDASTDFSFDLSEAAFVDGVGYSKNGDDNTIVEFNMDDLTEERVIQNSEKPSSGPEILTVDGQGNVFLINSLGIFEAGEGEDTMKKVSSLDMISGVTIEDMVFDYSCVDKSGAIYIHMYDTSEEAMQQHFYKITEQGK